DRRVGKTEIDGSLCGFELNGVLHIAIDEEVVLARGYELADQCVPALEREALLLYEPFHKSIRLGLAHDADHAGINIVLFSIHDQPSLPSGMEEVFEGARHFRRFD